MRVPACLLVILLSSRLSAQTTEQSEIVGTWASNVFYTDLYEPYLFWAEKPVSFTFEVYNQWGEVLFSENKNPDFNFTDVKEGTFQERNYLMNLRYILPDGKCYEKSWTAYYFSFYCAG